MARIHTGAHGPQRTNTAAAAEANRQFGAERAADDPVKLAKAIRIVRVALSRGRITITDLDGETDV